MPIKAEETWPFLAKHYVSGLSNLDNYTFTQGATIRTHLDTQKDQSSFMCAMRGVVDEPRVQHL